jgi:3D (Asp-Asp-Asp) domain-containing protein
MTGIATSALVAFFVAAGGTTSTSLWAAQPLPVPPPAYQVGLTGYNAVPAQTDNDPEVTASGAYSNPDVVAARSRDLADELPFGTVIAITAAGPSPDCGYGLVDNLIGLRVIADTMNSRMHNKVDILFDTDATVKAGGKEVNAARALGVCRNVTISVVGHVDPTHIPKDQLGLKLAIGQNVLAVR